MGSGGEPSSHCDPTWWEGGERGLWVPFTRALILLMGAPSHDLITFQRPPPNTTTLGVRISTYDFGEDANIQPVATTGTLRSSDLD